MAMRSIRDNTLAGLFVATGLVLGVWVSFWLGNRDGVGRTNRIIVKFPLAVGAPGLKPGSAVTLGGQRIGSVTEVTFGPAQVATPGAPPSSPPQSVEVTVKLPAAITILKTAQFSLERPLIGSVSSINIGSMGGNAVPGVNPLADGDVVEGGIAPPAFLAQTGITPGDINTVRRSIDLLEASLLGVKSAIDESTPNVKLAVTDAKAIVADLRARLGAWTQSVDSTLTNVEQASGRVEPILKSVEGVVSEADQLLAGAQGIIDDNRQNIADVIAAVESAASKFDKATIEEIDKAMRSAGMAIDAFQGAVSEASALITSQRPNVQHIMANLRLMSDNVKLTAIEVRSQPWRALHSPTKKELSTQSMYDATRAYAAASSDLRGASESLTALLQLQQTRTFAGDAKTVEEAAILVRQSMEKFKGTEQKLMDVLIREEKK